MTRIKLYFVALAVLALNVALGGSLGIAAIGALLIGAALTPVRQRALFTAPSPVIKGDNTVLWGTGGTYSTAIVVSARDHLTGEIVEVSDNNGFASSVVLFNDKNECEVQIIVQTAAPSIARGDAVTVCGHAGCVATDTELMWEQKGVRKYTLRATKFAGFAAS